MHQAGEGTSLRNDQNSRAGAAQGSSWRPSADLRVLSQQEEKRGAGLNSSSVAWQGEGCPTGMQPSITCCRCCLSSSYMLRIGLLQEESFFSVLLQLLEIGSYDPFKCQ